MVSPWRKGVVKEMMQKLYEKCVPVEKREHVEKIIVPGGGKLGGRQKLAAALFSLRAKKDGGASCRIGGKVWNST